jgi:tryptophanyl-tRNA synthetase
MKEGKKRLFTGLQPSGQLHIGNYFGALKPFVDTYQKFDSMLMVADYHSLTSLKDPKALRENIIDIVRSYLAIGVNGDEAVIFKQSDIQEHTELAWIFETLVTVPYLERAHAYKDKVAKGMEANAGLFNYPMLMAADILLYDTDIVPVGADQRQHVEYAREAASKFNNAYGETFAEPKEKILENVAVVPGVDGEKMSKSYKNTIPLFGTKEEIAKAVMSVITDSGIEDENSIASRMAADKYVLTGEKSSTMTFMKPINLYRIHRLFKEHEDLVSLYELNQGNYKAIKEALIEDIEAFVAPMRAKYVSINEDEVKRVLKNGAEKARVIAQEKMKEVRQKVGVTI